MDANHDLKIDTLYYAASPDVEDAALWAGVAVTVLWTKASANELLDAAQQAASLGLDWMAERLCFLGRTRFPTPDVWDLPQVDAAFPPIGATIRLLEAENASLARTVETLSERVLLLERAEKARATRAATSKKE
jgi:hypothetical protein